MADASPTPASSDTRCHFFKIPLELRDNIYDYVAYGEEKIDLHVNLETAKEPELHAYDHNLSQTCSQIRQEYTTRLQHRVKLLVEGFTAVIDLMASQNSSRQSLRLTISQTTEKSRGT